MPKLADFSLEDFKVAGGVGLRFIVSRKEHVNLRVDYALGHQTQGIYFNISEAF